MTVKELYDFLYQPRATEIRQFTPAPGADNVSYMLKKIGTELLTKSGPNGIPFFISHHDRYNQLVEHPHDFFEIIYVLHGSLTQVNREERKVLPAGSICIIRPGERHHFLPAEYEDLAVAIVLGEGIMHPRFQSTIGRLATIGGFMRPECREPLLFCEFGPESLAQHLGELLLCSYFDPNSHSAISSELYLQLFLTEVDRAANPIAVQTEQGIDADIPRIARYIQHHYADVVIDDVAQEFGYTGEYISRKLKEHYGYSFIPYRNRQCLIAAATMLSTTTLAVGEIAIAVGIPNASHFGKIFAAEYHMSPRAYRQMFRA